MIEISLAIFATAALTMAGYSSFRSEKDKRQRRLVFLANGFALIAIWIQFSQQLIQGDADEKKHAELSGRYEALLGQNNQLLIGYRELKALNHEMQEKQTELISKNSKLHDQLMPILEIAKAKNPGFPESDALAKLLLELEKLNPKLMWISDKTTTEENVENGPYRTTFYFESRFPVAIRDARLALVFDKTIKRVEVKAPNNLPFTDNLKVRYVHQRSIVVTAAFLGEAGRLNVSVLTDTPVRLVSAALQP
jgi:hypothetical protein